MKIGLGGSRFKITGIEGQHDILTEDKWIWIFLFSYIINLYIHTLYTS